MKRSKLIDRYVGSGPAAMTAAAMLAGAFVPLSAFAANTVVTVTGTDLTVAGSYSNNTVPGTSTEVQIVSTTSNSLTLSKASASASLSAATLDDLYTGTATINNNLSNAGGSNITLFASGASTSSITGQRDAIYIAAGSNTLNYNSTGGHSNTLTVGNSSYYNIGTGDTFNFSAASAGQLNLGRFLLLLTGGGNVNLGTLTNSATDTLITDGGAGGSLSVGDNASPAVHASPTSNATINLAPSTNVSYTGLTTITPGSALTINVAGTTGTLAYGATGAVTDNGTLTLAPFNGRTLAFANNVGGTGSLVFQKSVTAGTGSAFLNLTGNNSYAGGTTISGGTVRANGISDALGTGTTAVNATGTLAGGTKAAPGVTGGIVSVNGDFMGVSGGTLTAGTGATAADTVGTLSMTSLNLNGGSYDVKLDGANATAGPAGSGTAGSLASDLLLLGGVTSNGADSLTINPVFLTSGSSSFSNAAPGTTYSFVIADDTASATAFDSLINQGATSAITVSNASTLGTFALNEMPDGGSGEDLLLDFTTTAAVPEPTSLLWAALAAIPLALGRRRQSAVTH